MSQRLRAIQKILGVIIVLSSLSKLPPALLALLWDEQGTAPVYFASFLSSTAVGLVLWLPVRRVHYELRLRDGFLIVTLTWVFASLVSALPFVHAPPYLSYTDAIFEATSGLTTTGATVISGLDQLPRSVLFYRQSLQFLGGMGIVILAVAILPMLRIGGTQLFRAESTGPTKDTKLTPRVAETAKALWAVYFGLTVLCAAAYWVAGMDLFDAIGHAMSTVSTGGFSTHDAAFDYWDSPILEWIAILFMLLGGINFGLHYVAWRRASMAVYGTDSELRAFLRIVAGASLVVTLVLWFGGDYAHLGESFRLAVFQVVSSITTTGFTVSGFDHWTGPAPFLVVTIAVIGGCSGSTVGGLKVARVVMVVRQGYREIKQLVHPKAQFLVKMGGRRVSESVVLSVSGFIAIWMLCFALLVVGMNLSGLDLESSYGAAVATLANLGPGLGDVAYTFGDTNDMAVWLGTLGMILGRLEVFSLLVLLTPAFWRE
ncbi:TrkH family potassium uptake protein [Arenimonas fontis]|uniref:Trk system potassium uptake protein n=1 Tax=Arenimonas fontis TaxID=2608255 RepID=A0A5B2Z785_9GAMM|nr:TrkH family potassium uptake protein [Arenimonas fontis]KAA2284628.1 potassium transporter [Arenimonas fontis]